MSVGLVLVSHSGKLAEGLAEVAAQMAPDVTIVAAGGLPDGGIGTDYDRVLAAIGRADSGDGVVLLYDLGSARMTAEIAAESSRSPSGTETAVVADAPFVEGTVAAAVAAQGGADRTAVATAAAEAMVAPAMAADATAADATAAAEAAAAEAREVPEPEAPSPGVADVESIGLELTNDIGLHARPAALLVRSLTGIDAGVSVRLGEQEADGRSVLALMSLGARKGDRIEVSARGAQAVRALEAIRKLVERNFDESGDASGTSAR